MSFVIVHLPNEPLDQALKRFNRKVQQDRILAEYRRRLRHETRSQKRKRKKAAALRKARKRFL